MDIHQEIIRTSLRRVIEDTSFVIVLGCLSFCVGLTINALRPSGLPLVYLSKEVRLQKIVDDLKQNVEEARGNLPDIAQSLSFDQFRARVLEKRWLILDARPEAFYRLGHVPGALSLPREDFKKGYLKIQNQKATAFADNTIVYCSDNACDDSLRVRSALVQLGWRHVFVFRGGWDEWSRAGMPSEAVK